MLQIQQVSSTRELQWNFENNCFGACATAAKMIAKGETAAIHVFERPDKQDTTKLSYKQCFYFGIADIEGRKALRVSNCEDLTAAGSHSLIASGNKSAKDPVFISARLCRFLTHEGSDWFINPEIV